MFRPGAIIGGALGALGILVLLQQYALVEVTTSALLLTICGGLACGIFVPWIAFAIGMSAANRAAGPGRPAGHAPPARPPRPPRPPAGAWIGLGLLIALLGVAAPSEARIDGDCTGELQGIDVTGPIKDPVDVDQGDDAAYSFHSDNGITHTAVTLHYGPFSRVIDEDDYEDGTTTVEGDAAVSDYAWMGVGLYRLGGTIDTGTGIPCDVSVLIHVHGNPLTTLMGLLGLAAGLGGTIAFATSTITTGTQTAKGFGA